RYGPVPAVHQARRRICQAGRLGLRQRRGGFYGGHLASSHSGVIPHPVNVDAVRARVRFDLERDGAALVDADVGGETLNGRIACIAGTHIPLTLGISRETIFSNNGVRRTRALASYLQRIGGTK